MPDRSMPERASRRLASHTSRGCAGPDSPSNPHPGTLHTLTHAPSLYAYAYSRSASPAVPHMISPRQAGGTKNSSSGMPETDSMASGTAHTTMLTKAKNDTTPPSVDVSAWGAPSQYRLYTPYTSQRPPAPESRTPS